MADAGPSPLEGGYEVVGWLRAHAIELGAPALPSLEVVAKKARYRCARRRSSR